MKAKKAILWTNGMLTVFDENGKQMPSYQGIGKEKIPALRLAFPECPIEGMDWNTDVRPGLPNSNR